MESIPTIPCRNIAFGEIQSPKFKWMRSTQWLPPSSGSIRRIAWRPRAAVFAQHIARHLQASGFSYFVTETAHPLFNIQLTRDYNYGVFSARYGNIYTSRQLLQLLHRAYDIYVPAEDLWELPGGRCIDPFRPRIQPNGFATAAEFAADRVQHFRAVRQVVEELSVFVFTLGLTETWVCRTDGAAFPLCPGISGGSFDSSRHVFLNLGVTDVIGDLNESIDFIRLKNPTARIILTVSPVPLAATAENRSVLVSTTYSKSVLRVAAEETARHRDYVAYFPSYEIITGAYARGSYFADDLRNVTESGVDHVMRLFMRHYASSDINAATNIGMTDLAQRVEAHSSRMERMAKLVCEEELLDPSAFV